MSIEKPSRKLVSLDGMLEDKNEEELPLKIKRYFIDPSGDNRERYEEIDEAFSELSKKQKKMADILTQRYREGKTQEEVAKDYDITLNKLRRLEEQALRRMRQFIEYGIKD